jgi:TIR domain
MTISQRELRGAAQRVPLRKSIRASTGQPTAFLCHSHKDRTMAEGLQQLMMEAGFNVYIDWQDSSMPATPTRETASRIKRLIVAADWFIFLATENSMASRWCPWEIGYADGKKELDDIILVPTSDDSGKYYGNEYLQLYNTVKCANGGGWALFPPGDSNGYWLGSL